MTKQLNYNFLSLFVGILLCSLPFQAVGQSPASQPQNATLATTQAKPVSLPHLYWHFLVYQHYLDELAVSREKQGKDGQAPRLSLQNQMGFSDIDFAPIRTSADRLAAEIAPLDAQAKAILTAAKADRQFGFVPSGSAPPDTGQLKVLASQRETDINTEIATLTQALSPQNKAAMDKFLVQFFAPKKLVYPAASSTRPSAVQK